MPEDSSVTAASLYRGPIGPGIGRISLPKPLTSFIGRERELAQATRLLQGSYLVTLTGPGGSGKTRLCIALAEAVAGDYPDGVYFVPLAPVQDPVLVPSTIAQSIGLQDARDRPLMEHLVSQLAGRQVLIVLDNFEHLLAGAPVVTRLLQETGTLRILVSSRSSLRVSGEQECPIPPLPVPEPGTCPTAASLAGCESVRLFAERAAAAVPGFTVTDENAAAIAQITRRLDGLPLAIELAAARVKLLPPELILPRLEHSLGLLTGGHRDLPGRQQTLRGTIAWSHDLLTEEARRLLATCSVFAGSATLEGIETVCAVVDIGLPVLDGLQELADHSLLRQVRGPGRHLRGTRCWRRSVSTRPNGWRRCRKRTWSAAPTRRLSWPWCKPAAARTRAWPRRNGWNGSTLSTTTSARRLAGTGGTTRPPRSDQNAATTPRAGSAWTKCSAWSPSRPSTGSAR
jgi:predicted ATPase